MRTTPAAVLLLVSLALAWAQNFKAFQGHASMTYYPEPGVGTLQRAFDQVVKDQANLEFPLTHVTLKLSRGVYIDRLNVPPQIKSLFITIQDGDCDKTAVIRGAGHVLPATLDHFESMCVAWDYVPAPLFQVEKYAPEVLKLVNNQFTYFPYESPIELPKSAFTLTPESPIVGVNNNDYVTLRHQSPEVYAKAFSKAMQMAQDHSGKAAEEKPATESAEVKKA